MNSEQNFHFSLTNSAITASRSQLTTAPVVDSTTKTATLVLQTLGYSFWLAAGGAILQIAALFCSIICAILIFVIHSQQKRTNKPWQTSKMNNVHHNTTV
ncbi:hypothetical protein Tsp_07702 [Trichinella spiralis]|uniref:hypothetical protein n=1 Tax=Trichinella spiralis TaxID=6334 RepID=UPI0001EFC816|nr:hypothetical protein Tsp_07702 [Trichinella spiralis]